MGLFSRKKKKNDKAGYDFHQYAKKGVCDACGKHLTEEDAHVVPAKEFYASPPFQRDTVLHTFALLEDTPAWSEDDKEQILLFVMDEFAKHAQTDKAPFTVCEDCYFEGYINL
jgi:hypothetical protein